MQVGLEIREEDAKGNFVYVPRDRDCFKLRSSVEKRVVVTLAQISDNLTTLKVQCTLHLTTAPCTSPPHLAPRHRILHLATAHCTSPPHFAPRHRTLHLATAPCTWPVHQVERCFGMLVSPGRNVRHSDMQLLEGVRCGAAGQGIVNLRFQILIIF